MSSKYRWREKITVATAENTYSSAKLYHTIKLRLVKKGKDIHCGLTLKAMKHYKLILVNNLL